MAAFSRATTALSSLVLLSSSTVGNQELIKSHENQFHRSLADFVLPFSIRWRFTIFDVEGAPEDRQPTEAEYDGIREATVDMFAVEIPRVYENEDDFSFQEISCEIEDVLYDPTVDQETEFVHQILLFCDVTWDAENLEDTPDIVTFLNDLNADFVLDNFVENHLRDANPEDPPSLFRFSQRVAYITDENGTRGPAPPAEETEAPETEAPVPLETPAPSPANPGPQTPMPTDLPARKVAPEAKCGSLASTNGRGGSAADAKGCGSRLLSQRGVLGKRTRKLKGSSY